jgi:hypothetical protein
MTPIYDHDLERELRTEFNTVAATYTANNACEYASWLSADGHWYNHPSITNHSESLKFIENKMPVLAKIPGFQNTGNSRMRRARVYTGAALAKCRGNEMNILLHPDQQPLTSEQIRAIKDQFCLPRYRVMYGEVVDLHAKFSGKWEKDDDITVNEETSSCESIVDRMASAFRNAVR